MGHKLIGQILLELGAGAVTVDAIDQALVLQAKEGGRLGEVLIKMRVASEEDVLQALGRQLGIAVLVDLKVDEIDGELATKIPIGFSKQHRVLPLRMEGGSVLVATADPLDVWALDDLRGKVGGDVVPVLLPSSKILDLINLVYGKKHDSGGNLGEGEEDEVGGESEELVDILDITEGNSKWILFSTKKQLQEQWKK